MKRKKTNLFVILFLLISALVVTAAAKAFCEPHIPESITETGTPPAIAIPEDVEAAAVIMEAIGSTEADTTSPEQEEITLQQESPSCDPQAVESAETQEQPIESIKETPEDTMPAPASMENALFIGDSRTVGLAEYAYMDGAHFFATVGMSVYGVSTAKISVHDVGKVTLSELLKNYQYDKIYVMLGINELGYPFEKTLKKYSALIQSIQETQPDTLVFVQANLHVTKERSDSDKVVNNPRIDAFNDNISQFADNERVFYLDANCLFDDADGALSETKKRRLRAPVGKVLSRMGQLDRGADRSNFDLMI